MTQFAINIGSPVIGGSDSGYVLKQSGVAAVLKSKLDAVVDPTTLDDSGAGYAAGSRWINTTTGKVWECVSAAPLAAVWKDLTATTPPAGSGTELQYRAGGTAFGAISGSAVSGANVTLGGTLSATELSLTGSGTGTLFMQSGVLRTNSNVGLNSGFNWANGWGLQSGAQGDVTIRHNGASDGWLTLSGGTGAKGVRAVAQSNTQVPFTAVAHVDRIADAQHWYRDTTRIARLHDQGLLASTYLEFENGARPCIVGPMSIVESSGVGFSLYSSAITPCQTFGLNASDNTHDLGGTSARFRYGYFGTGVKIGTIGTPSYPLDVVASGYGVTQGDGTVRMGMYTGGGAGGFGTVSNHPLSFWINNGADLLKIDGSLIAGETRLLLYDVDTAQLQRVKVGANGTGPGGVGRALYLAAA